MSVFKLGIKAVGVLFNALEKLDQTLVLFVGDKPLATSVGLEIWNLSRTYC